MGYKTARASAFVREYAAKIGRLRHSRLPITTSASSCCKRIPAITRFARRGLILGASAQAGAYRLFPPTTSITLVHLQENQVTLVMGFDNLDRCLCAWLTDHRTAHREVEGLRSVLWRRR